MISPFLSVRCSWAETLQWINQRLVTANLRPRQTFDLHGARVGSHGFVCPTHGTNECDCQMAVILVYDGAIEPVTLILYGNNGQAWLSIAEDANQKPDARLIDTIQKALQGKTTKTRDS
jgi:hypothetical protein